MAPPYPTRQVIINPGPRTQPADPEHADDVFRKHGVDWDVSITKRLRRRGPPGSGRDRQAA